MVRERGFICPGGWKRPDPRRRILLAVANDPRYSFDSVGGSWNPFHSEVSILIARPSRIPHRGLLDNLAAGPPLLGKDSWLIVREHRADILTLPSCSLPSRSVHSDFILFFLPFSFVSFIRVCSILLFFSSLSYSFIPSTSHRITAAPVCARAFRECPLC